MKTNYPTKKLGELFEITSSKRVFKSEWVDDGIPFYRAREVVSLSKGKEFRTPIFITNQMYEEYKDKYGVPKEGDLLATGVGTLGVCYRIKPDDKFYFKDGNIIWFKNISGVSPRYVELFFQSTNFKDQVEEYAGGATVKTFTIQTAKKIEIPFPPLRVQKKIVAKLEKLLAKVNEAKKLRAEAQESTSKLLPAKLHKIFEEGKKQGWEEKELEEVSESVADGTHDTPRYQDDGFPLVTSKNLRPEGLTFDTAKFISASDYEEINKRSHVSNGDILIGMIGTISNVTRVNTAKKFSIKNVGLVRPDEKQVLGQYITYYLDNSRLKSLIVTGGTTQKFMALGTLRKIKVIYPPLSEQKRIVARLDSISEKTKQLQEYQKTTSKDFLALEQSILSKAFSGDFV